MNAILPICTVGYLLRQMDGRKEIHLGLKAATEKAVRRKIAGKLLGYGGDFEPHVDLTIKESFLRELRAESGFDADPRDVETMAKVLILDETGPRLWLYWLLARRWTGRATANREFDSYGWYPTDPLPENILGADKLVLPRILKGEKLEGSVEYDRDMNVVSSEFATVDSIQ
ncbi:MAG TPA: hypothetical protein VFQ72_00885 [Candidatus Paceibacterota bacterium]|nr:hypothetical protein [Candidatus Paceibacterota bacterium]